MKPLHIIVAPDSFKDSLSAVAAAEAMERGIHAVFPTAEVVHAPMADGGEGTVQALVDATGGQILRQQVAGPLGDPVEAHWGILGDGETALIEMAAASGLALVPPADRDPRITTTYGTGQLIKAALDKGLRRIIVGLGGSATNDGGTGMAQALGAHFLDAEGRSLPPGGAALADLDRIDLSGADPRLQDTEILVACDVDNPLCGPSGASAVYGPQKGASAQVVAELDRALACFAEVARQTTGRDIANQPGAGAAGGLGAGLLFLTRCEFRPGIDLVLEIVDFPHLLQNADLVVTGEGCTDAQTACGKAPVGIAALAGKHQVPVVCLSGALGDDSEEVLKKGVDALMSIPARPMTLEECLDSAATLVEEATARLFRCLKVGMGMQQKSGAQE
ncbi:glycerate kinase [Geoalkalibacter subterraneus]|uniref:Glycerate kinase n=1 Tax=Geoalkalibacter subterraneus TaxID=483547 RepID=A0A0B5FI33_9BACT|nr:glycerate kinase [Geoalkalibacter subterraneus]AJF07852.1 glycerate kinase [Geoalkalibacter subterraneus]